MDPVERSKLLREKSLELEKAAAKKTERGERPPGAKMPALAPPESELED